MSDRLPKKLESYLAEISEHEGEPGYLRTRFDGMPFQDAFEDVVLLEGLADRDLIYTQGERLTIDEPGESGRAIAIKPTFFLTADAKLYLDGLPKAKRKQVAKVLLAILAALGSCAAIASLALDVSRLL